MLHLHHQDQDFHLLLLLCIDHIFHFDQLLLCFHFYHLWIWTNTTLFIKYLTCFFIKDNVCRKSDLVMVVSFHYPLLSPYIVVLPCPNPPLVCGFLANHIIIFTYTIFYSHLCLYHPFPILKHYQLLFFPESGFLAITIGSCAGLRAVPQPSYCDFLSLVSGVCSFVFSMVLPAVQSVVLFLLLAFTTFL